jgi:hypothetical protein
MILVLIIISPTLYHLWASFGIRGLRFYFIDNNLGRVSGELAGSSTDLFFYMYNLLWAFLPWTIPVFAGLAAEVRTWFRDRNLNIYSASLLGSTLALFLVYSIARGKAPSYLMMLVPPLSVVAAGRVQHFTGWGTALKSRLIYLHCFMLAVMVLLMFASVHITQENNWFLFGAITATSVIVMLFFLKAEKATVKRLMFISLVIAAAFNLYLNTVLLPELFGYQGARQALQLFKEHRTPEGVLKTLHLEEYELYYWADVPVRDFESWKDFYEFLEREEPWVYTNYIGLPVVQELTESIDSVFVIPQRGMNELIFQFLNPATREKSLTNNYLIKVK